MRTSWDAVEWSGERRLVGVECKGWGEEEYVLERCEVVRQHVAELLGRFFVRMEDSREDGPSAEIDRLAVLFCFCQNKFVVKWIEPSESTLDNLFGEVVSDAGSDLEMDNVLEGEDDEVVLPERHEEEKQMDEEEEEEEGGREWRIWSSTSTVQTSRIWPRHMRVS